jgi:hypothetical protein
MYPLQSPDLPFVHEMGESTAEAFGRKVGLMSDTQKPFSESGSSPPRRVTLIRVRLVPGCSVATGIGLDAEGREVTFAADWRTCLALAEALQSGHAVEVTLAGWQFICWQCGGRS